MNAFTLFSALLAATGFPVDAQTSKPAEPSTISVGAMSFSGETLKLTKSGTGSYECVIAGQAHLAIGYNGDEEMAIDAASMTISWDAESDKKSLRCHGACKLNSDFECSADSLSMELSGSTVDIQMSGNVLVKYGSVDQHTTLTAQSIEVKDGVINVTGNASLTTGP